jgi:hypothetical protein
VNKYSTVNNSRIRDTQDVPIGESTQLSALPRQLRRRPHEEALAARNDIAEDTPKIYGQSQNIDDPSLIFHPPP